MRYDDVSLEFSRVLYGQLIGKSPSQSGNTSCFRSNCTGSQLSMSIDNNQGRVLLHCFRCGFGGTMIDFLQEIGKNKREAFELLCIELSPEEKKYISLKEEIYNFLLKEYPRHKISFDEIYSFPFMDPKRFGVFLKEHNLLEQFKGYSSIRSYFKCVLRNHDNEKEFRLVYRHNDKIIVAEKQELKIFPYNFLKLFNWAKNKEDTRVVVLTEGEKDADTIEYLAGDKVIAISAKTGDSDWKNLILYLIASKTDKVYFIGDNDIAGYRYRKDLFLRAKSCLKHFYVVRLPNIDTLKKGADVTDWYEYRMSEGDSKTSITIVFKKSIFETNRLHDMMISEYFEAINEIKYYKDGSIKEIVPEHSWINIRSFFESQEVFLMRDVISGCTYGDYGFLRFMRAENQTGISMPDLQAELMYCGWKGLQLRHVDSLLLSYFSRRGFVQMADVISSAPKNSFIVEKRFHEDFSILRIPALLLWLINNIVFSEQSNLKYIALQKTMIYKALLALPYMLENTSTRQRRIKGDLRFVGGNSVGKSTFCRDLMTGYDKKTNQVYQWFQEQRKVDITDKDQVKVSFEAPCLIIDEGNLSGSNDEKKSFFDESVFRFIPKYKEISEEKIRRNIIISSSNNMINSYDAHSERRMWQVCVRKVPYLSCLPENEFLRDRNFWERNGVCEDDMFEMRDGEKYFKFPVIEFWRQMYAVYKYYEDKRCIEDILILNTQENGELPTYKMYMQDKTFICEEEQFLLNMFGEENWRKAEDLDSNIIVMPLLDFKDLMSLFFSRSKWSKISKALLSLIRRFDKTDYLSNHKMVHYGCFAEKKIVSVLVPLFDASFINFLEDRIRAEHQYQDAPFFISDLTLLSVGGDKHKVMANYNRYRRDERYSVKLRKQYGRYDEAQP